jgi:predicted dinucleotide-binding enzyme
MTTTWGLIGSGNIGSAIARLAVDAGHDVVLSNSRGPETLAGLVEGLGPQARAGTVEEAADAGDVVVVTIPLKAYPEVPADALAGKVVIDTMNYYPERDGWIPELSEGTTSSELLQAHLPKARVVKAFNSIFVDHLLSLARPAGAADRSALMIAGDDDEAKALVVGLLDEIGYDAVDVGPLAESWRVQPGSTVYGVLYAADPADWSAGAHPADVEHVTTALGDVRR